MLPGTVIFMCSATIGAQTFAASDAYYERGRATMNVENWYVAAEYFLEAVRLNPAHLESNAALSECYYELGEFDQALVWVRRARTLSRGNTTLANLEASILIALGQLDNADAVIKDIVAREPYNREALFAAAELDIARGRAGDAVNRYRNAVNRFPDDRRLLLSLSLTLGSMGDVQGARNYIERALEVHPDDYRVYYYAAYLESQFGNLDQALVYTENVLFYRPDYAPARSLMASLRYRTGEYEAAAGIADALIAENRNDVNAWYLKSVALRQMNRPADAMQTLTTAIEIDPNDEFVRITLEELLLAHTNLEDPKRVPWARWHFNRAQEYRTRNLVDQALFEYRRGLRLNPYAKDRQDYADLLRINGYPARYLEELHFMQDLGMGDQPLNDAVEAYTALLANSLHERWQVDPVNLSSRHWNVAVFSVVSQSSFFHADAGALAASYIKELLIHDRDIGPVNLELRQNSFSAAFQESRKAGADYFLIVSLQENERDLSIKGELFVARTGSPAASFYVYRTGTDRFRNASRGIVDALSASLPFRAELLQYRQGQGLIDKGRLDGVQPDTTYEIVRKGSAVVKNEGRGLSYTTDAVVGTLAITSVDEEVAAGTVSRNGFFDLVAPGDTIVLRPESPQPVPESQLDPELRRLISTVR